MSQTSGQPWLEGIRGTQVYPVINRDDSTIRVEAGPGTGKTFGLVRRVQRILHPDGLGTPGEQVLVVAFNRVIAKQLQEDIAKCLQGSIHDGDPIIRTVHALCLEIMGGDLRISLPHEQDAMIYDVLHTYPKLRERYRHSEAKQALRDHEAGHQQDLQLWQAVRQWLIRHHAQLIGDLPRLLLDRLKAGDFQNKAYKHVIVDEFQDLTPDEQELFLRLRHEEGTFVALGDPRQAIYAFRGNAPEGLKRLDELVMLSGGTVEKIYMTECQRCPAPVVKAANQLMGLSEAQAMVPMSDIPANTHVVTWNSLADEAEGMAKAIAANVQIHPRLANQAVQHLVMVTRRKFGYMLLEQLLDVDPYLKVELGFSEGLLEAWPVREAFLYFCLVADPDASTWRAWLGYQNPTDSRSFKAPQRNSDAYLRFLAACGDQITAETVENLACLGKQPPGKGGKNLLDRAKRFAQLKAVLQWGAKDVSTFLDEVFEPSKWGCESPASPGTTHHDMGQVLSLAQHIYQGIQKVDIGLSQDQQLRLVADKLRYQIATREPFADGESSDLLITTLWGAKGVTARHVYVIGVCGEAIPGVRRPEYPGTELDYDEEQRRLFYVSITRSKETLVLSRALHIKQSEAKRLHLATKGNGFFRNLEMSPYLSDIMVCLPEYQKGQDWGGCIPSQDVHSD